MGNLFECLTGVPKLQQKTVTPSNSVQNVTPDSGYDGLSKVTVNSFNSNLKTVTKEIDTTTQGGDLTFNFPEFTKVVGVTKVKVVQQDYWTHVVTSDINIADNKVVVTVVETKLGGVFYHAYITAIGY